MVGQQITADINYWNHNSFFSIRIVEQTHRGASFGKFGIYKGTHGISLCSCCPGPDWDERVLCVRGSSQSHDLDWVRIDNLYFDQVKMTILEYNRVHSCRQVMGDRYGVVWQ